MANDGGKLRRVDHHFVFRDFNGQDIGHVLVRDGITASWTTLRETLSVQQRVAATFKQRDGKTLNIRKATVAEKNLKEIYEKLCISVTPGGIQKLTM